jgi:hypothetical protein
MNNTAPFTALLDLLDKLQDANIFFRLRYSRPRTIDVDIDLPDGRWEVGFEEDGYFDVEKFVSREGVGDDELMQELLTDIEACRVETKEK